MSSYFDLGRLFSRKPLNKVVVKVTKYPKSVIVSEEDSLLAQEDSVSLEDFLWSYLAAGRDFEAMEVTKPTAGEVAFLLNPESTSTGTLTKAFNKGGLNITIVSQEPIRAKFGYFRF